MQIQKIQIIVSDNRKLILKVMVIDKRKGHVFISNLFMFIQNFHPI